MSMKMKLLLSATAIAFSSSVIAVEPEVYITDSGISIVPIINTGYKYDNNIFSQASETTGSGIFTLAPAVKFLLDDGINNYQLDFGLESGTFLDSSADNYVIGNLGFTSHLEPSSRSRFDLELEANKDVEPRGTGLTEGLGDSVDEPLLYNEQLAKLSYEYGSLASSGRIAVMGRYYNKNYTNFTGITERRSFNQSTLGSTFFYTTNASTDAFIEIKAGPIKYDVAETISRDSDMLSALVGIKWEATALTSGSFKIGQEQKNFSDTRREDFKGVSWEGNVDWQPLTYTTLTLETSRAAKDPDGQGDYISESIYGANWKHEWNEKVTTTLNYSYIREEYTGFERLDKSNNFYVDVNYAFKRWVDVALFIEYTDQNSTRENIVYDKNVIGLDFTFSL
ncbi:MAG: outer membrane beta-barrel protein [Colwellia sp.]|nr:outer membrane beta-barrel protein [Colwellia sp.]